MATLLGRFDDRQRLVADDGIDDRGFSVGPMNFQFLNDSRRLEPPKGASLAGGQVTAAALDISHLGTI